MITWRQAVPGTHLIYDDGNGPRPCVAVRPSSTFPTLLVRCRFGNSDEFTTGCHIYNLDLDPAYLPGGSMAPEPTLDEVRSTLAKRLEMYPEDATIPVGAATLQTLLDGLTARDILSNAATEISTDTLARISGLETEANNMATRLVTVEEQKREAEYSLDTVKQLANQWLFVTTGSYSTDEEAWADRAAHLLLKIVV